MIGKMTLTASNDGTMRAFLPAAGNDRAASMVRGGEHGCVAIDTTTDQLVPRGAKAQSILCMRTVGDIEPGGPYVGGSVRAWCSSTDGTMQVCSHADLHCFTLFHILMLFFVCRCGMCGPRVQVWSGSGRTDCGADVFRIDRSRLCTRADLGFMRKMLEILLKMMDFERSSKRLYCASNAPDNKALLVSAFTSSQMSCWSRVDLMLRKGAVGVDLMLGLHGAQGERCRSARVPPAAGSAVPTPGNM